MSQTPLKFIALTLILFGLVACNAASPIIQDSFSEPTLTPLPTEPPSTPTPVPGGAAEVGQTFYQAWVRGDYLGMYSLITPQSQALVSPETFESLYRQALQSATVQAIRIQPQGALQEENRGTLQVQVIWETSVLGNIERTHTADLAFSNGRWGVVWDESLIMPELEGGNRLALDYRAPARANIYDINGRALAYQGTAILLGVVPGDIVDEAGLLATLSPLLGQTPEELKALYANAQPGWYVPLGDIPASVMQTNYDLLEPYLGQGLQTSDRLTRIYEPIAPHLVGYTGAIDPSILDQYLALGYRPDAEIGLAGIEAWGESYLSGQRGGVLSVVTQDGKPLSVIAETDAKQARSVYTTFDIDFQLGVEQILAEMSFGQPAAAVVLDVNTGDVIAMASVPTYNPGAFDSSRPDSGAAISALFQDPSNPLLNRAAFGAYPPGSTFKVITLAAAVQSGLYTPESKYNSTGTWSVLGENFVKTDWREGGHGYISYSTALVVSCNTCFYEAGYRMNEVNPYFLPDVAKDFGLGQSTGIIGIDDAPGTIPDPEWKPINTAEGGWVPGDAVNMSIGQGYVTATPLQMAQVASAIANDGVIYTPKLIDRIGEGGGAPEETIPPQVSTELIVEGATIDAIQSAMEDVTRSSFGTATFVFEDFDIPVAGKTGTAENAFITPHAWFIGYAPSAPVAFEDGSTLDGPQIAISVIVENGGEGSETAAPIFERIARFYFESKTTPSEE